MDDACIAYQLFLEVHPALLIARGCVSDMYIALPATSMHVLVQMCLVRTGCALQSSGQ